MGVVIDSSVFVASERRRFDWIRFHSQLLDDALYVASITVAELLHGVHRADSQERRTKRSNFVAGVEAQFPVLSFGRDEAAEYANIWAELSMQGKLIGTHDMMIAAIARRGGHRIATLNGGEFRRVPELDVLDAEPYRTK